MKELKLLIVEDDPNVIATYKREIESYNKTNEGLYIQETICSDKDQALDILKNSDNIFDGAVIDLDLKQSGGSDNSGNDVIKEIKGNLRFPIFVISGTSHNLDSSLREETSFFRVIDRGDNFNFIEEFVAIYNTGITEILNRRGVIEGYINNIFWKHISTSMDVWIHDSLRSPEEKQKSLLRYTLLHIQEYLELTEESDFEDYHPAEIYITPPVKPNVFTGDIVTEIQTGNRYIVLTPSCDLANFGKTETVLLVQIQNKNIGEINRLKTIINNPEESAGNKKSAEKELKKLISNSKSGKFHFLPDYKDIEAGLINFQLLKSVRKDSISVDFSRIASVNSTFIKDIVARFSYYYSRQGSPDFDVEEIYSSVVND